MLFNPGTVMAPFPGLELKGFGAGLDKARFGCEPTEISPLHHVTKGLPPTIIFHGKADTTVPYATAEAFARVMKAAGNRCDLVGYEGQPHGFFNHGRKDSKYPETLDAMDAVLVSLGWLAAVLPGTAGPEGLEANSLLRAAELGAPVVGVVADSLRLLGREGGGYLLTRCGERYDATASQVAVGTYHPGGGWLPVPVAQTAVGARPNSSPVHGSN